jgi:predicted Zn-dependent peptidase
MVPTRELQRTKDHMIGNLILGLETSDALAGFYGAEEILTKKLLPPEAIVDRIKKVTAAEVRAVARQVFIRKGLNFAVIGPYQNKRRFEKLLK